MGASDIQPIGRPRTEVKKDFEYFIYCGGKGGGSGLEKTGQVFYKFLVKNDKFSVRNNRLVINNVNFVVYKEATYNGFAWVPVPGSEATLRAWAFTDDLASGTESDKKYMAGGIPLPGPPPYDIVFEGRKPGAPFVLGDLPQPGDPGYKAFSSIYLFWDSTDYWWYGYQGSQPFNTFLIKKLDTESRQ